MMKKERKWASVRDGRKAQKRVEFLSMREEAGNKLEITELQIMQWRIFLTAMQ